MRVAHVVCSDGFGGVERYLSRLAPGLAERGVTVTVVGGREAEMRAALAGTGVDWRPGNTMLEAARSLRGLDVDLVASHMTQADLVGSLAHLPRRTPVVGTAHFPAGRGSTPARRLVGGWLGRRLAATVAVSDHVATLAPSTVTVRSGVPSSPDAPDAVLRRPVVLVAQRLEAEKETDVAVRAWAATRARHRGWQLWVAGSGAQEASLRTLAATLGVADSVRFLGYRTDVVDLYRSTALLLAPCSIEAFGLSAAEAMAVGEPVVASAAAGHVETVGAVDDRLLFAPGDPVDAARAIDRLADDDALRTQVGARCAAVQRSLFDLDRQVEETLAVYRRVLAR